MSRGRKAGATHGFWARWWADPVNKAFVIAPFLLFLFYFLFLRD